MQPNQERVVVEKDELSGRLAKLNVFLGGDVFKALPEIEQLDLSFQASAMSEYLGVLNRRISRFKTSPAKENR